MSRFVKYVIQIRIHRFPMEGLSGRLHTLNESIIKESANKSHGHELKNKNLRFIKWKDEDGTLPLKAGRKTVTA